MELPPGFNQHILVEGWQLLFHQYKQPMFLGGFATITFFLGGGRLTQPKAKENKKQINMILAWVMASSIGVLSSVEYRSPKVCPLIVFCIWAFGTLGNVWETHVETEENGGDDDPIIGEGWMV